jgi:hypothetical protein
MWYTYTMEYYSAIRNEIIPFAGKWKELEIIISQISKAQKDKYCTSSLICRINT